MSKKSYLYFIATIAVMGGLMFGFDIAIISGAVPFIQSYFGWSELQLGWGVSSLIVGAIVGSLISGILTDRFGRKGVLIVVALFFALSCIGSAMATTSFFFIFFRIIGGLSVGAVSVLSPMYVAEVMPSKIRGTFVSVYQLAITFGILISYSINYLLHDWDDNWRWMFATGAIPSVLFFIGLFFIPESPRWLFLKGEREHAFRILCRLLPEAEAERELTALSAGTEKGIKPTMKDFSNTSVRKSLYVGFFLAVLIQITGINTVIDYAPKILLSSGVEIGNALLQTSLIGIVNFAFTFIAILLIDKVGRKPLYLVGSIAMTVTLISLAATFYFELSSSFALISLTLFIAAFASCIGPVFWTMIAEIFPNKVRGRAIAFASFTQWIFNFLVVLFFPHVLKNIGGTATFLFLAAMCVIQYFFIKFYVPETKGKTLEEIESHWKTISN